MKAIRTFIRYFVKNERGVTAIEYGLIAALIAVAIVVIVDRVGDQLVNVFNMVDCKLARTC